MIPLRITGSSSNISDTIVGYASRGNGHPSEKSILLVEDAHCTDHNVEGFKACLIAVHDAGEYSDMPTVSFGEGALAHIDDGDIVALSPSGAVNTLFRVNSRHNALFITDRCNSNCLMCSQPPKDRDDLDHHFGLNLELIKLLPTDTKELGITGGEPTLLGNRLMILLEALKDGLPGTYIHMLTNGRVFAWREWAQKLSAVKSPNLMLGIPLYSDYYAHHDYVVQAKDAFNQTMLGLYNLARHGQRVELRVVLHKQTQGRLVPLSRFIYKNLPFTEHIAFMGLEYTGYTPHNHSLLWIEPEEYMEQLAEAALYLHDMGMNVSIYNLPLCLLPRQLWKFSRKSISDWKQEYSEECPKCVLLEECGGVFATSKRQSEHIQAIYSI